MADLDDLQVLATNTYWLSRHREQLSKLEALRDAEIQRANDWFADAASGELNQIERLMGEIEQWALAHRTDKEKSWATPGGKVATRVSRGRLVIVDEDALRAWCEVNGALVEKPPAIDSKAVRDAAETVVDGQLIVEGEIVPGAAIEGEGDVTVTVT